MMGFGGRGGRGRDGGRDSRGGRQFRGGRGGGGRPAPASGEESPFFQKMCNFYIKGTCRSGDQCKFMHAASRLVHLPAHAQPLKSIAILGDGPALVTGSPDKTVKCWDLSSPSSPPQTISTDGEVQHVIIVANLVLWANSTHPSGHTPSDTVGVVEMLDLSNNTRAKCLRSETMPYTHPMPIACFTSAVIGDNLFVFTAGGEGLIRAWQYNKPTNSFTHITVFEGHTRGVTSLLYVGGNLWSGSMDRSIRCWTLATGECIGQLTSAEDGHSEPVTCLELIPPGDQEYVASGGADSMLKIWSLSGSVCYSESQGAIVTALKSSTDKFGNGLLLVGLIDGRILIRASTMTLLFRLDPSSACHRGAVWAIENCGQGCFATGGEDGQLMVWNIDANLACS